MAWGSHAQSVAKKFSNKALLNPIAHSQWFDENIPVVEVTEFQIFDNNNSFLLENGYALFSIKNPENIKLSKKLGETVSIDIIFTKYPLRKEDWITNYYELLANRLKALFEIDSSLNSENIQWRLVLQTKGQNESEAVKLFHGIQIAYQKDELVSIKNLSAYPFAINRVETIHYGPCISTPAIVEKEDSEDPSDSNVLYPESVWNREVGTVSPPKKTKTNEPPCPKFTTRMDKPKRNLIDRIRGR
jgi:hypothetical protein